MCKEDNKSRICEKGMCIRRGVELHKKTPEMQTIDDGFLILSPILQKTDLSTLLERAYPYSAWLTWHRETGNIFFWEKLEAGVIKLTLYTFILQVLYLSDQGIDQVYL